MCHKKYNQSHVLSKTKEEGKYQEFIQSNTTSRTPYGTKHKSQEANPFSAGDHKAARFRQDSMIRNTNNKKGSTNWAILKIGLVTYIQVNVYIGDTLSWLNGGWAFKTDVCWRLNNHISVISLHIFDFFHKALVHFTSFKAILLYLLNVYQSLWTSARNLGTFFSYFWHF